MSSKKEEERNEKIIRGLMKLPPNRRCVNCNSLGPQYVCTNFWTFVCTTCSGIHREFTHRVKSVSMSKFTSQEVDALQKGGNQRARDIYLKDWDLQRQRLPDNSNVERVREFLKAVYVDKRYAGGKLPDKPPRDTQSLRNLEDETRRASSYHSYSQSPPYDYQYEERRYGKQGAVLTRKPGSDRGRYEGNISGLVYSPDRSSEQRSEDRFANDSNASRVSDYSASSGGYPSKPGISGMMSPNFQKEADYGSPGTHGSSNILTRDEQRKTLRTFSESNVKGLAEGIRHAQRTTSSGTFGSFDSNSPSLQSVNSSNFMDVISEPEQSLGVQQEESWAFPTSTTLPVASSTSTSDLFQASSIASSSSGNLVKPPHTSQSTSSSLQEQQITNLDKNPPHLSVPKDEGWATFDVPQYTESSTVNQNFHPSKLPLGDVDALEKLHSLPSSNTNMQWPSSQNSNFQGVSPSWHESLQEPIEKTNSVPSSNTNMWPSSQVSNFQGVSPSLSTTWHGSLQEPLEKSNSLPSSNTNMQWPTSQISNVEGFSSSLSAPWHDILQKTQASSNAFTPQPWNAFGESSSDLHPENTQQRSQQEAPSFTPSLFANQYSDFRFSEDPSREGSQIPDSGVGFSVSSIPSYDDRLPSYGQYFAPVMGMQSHGTGIKSSNPFDVQFDSDSESSNMQFPDMSSLQTALPSAQLPSAFAGGVAEPWFPQNLGTPYSPTTAQGDITYIAGQAPSSQLPSVPAQGSVTSLGGNPFA